MKKKIVWLLVSCLMVVPLVLASCAPAAEEEEEVVVTPAEEEVVTPEEEEEVAPAPEGPQYGGMLVYVKGADPFGFDEALGAVPWFAYALHLTNEELLKADWTKGPAGTGELSFVVNAMPRLDGWTGSLAESWELADANTIVYHLRKGIRWQDKPPVNGRELIADDVVFSIKRNFETGTAYLFGTYPEEQRPVSVTAPDKYTVVVECPPGQAGEVGLQACGEICRIVAPEVIEEYGDMGDWRNVVGTGPFVLSDYVSMSALTFVRNPDYWCHDPLHPDNTLPYLDSVKILIIADTSTALAALRTAKIDRLGAVSWEEAPDLRRTNPELKERSILTDSPYLIFMRTDTPPFDDIRVRRALAMAIDNEAIKVDYYGGNAEIQAYPVTCLPAYMDMYTPLEELPESVRELYEYHPDKARQLLAEAGYPDGFETEIICPSGLVDMLSIYKDCWDKIGVELELNVKETAIWHSLCVSHRHKQMITRYMSASIPFKMYAVRPGTTQNMSIINDPHINEVHQVITDNFFNEDVRRPLMKEIAVYILDKAWMIQIPAPYGYCMWWPWLKGYHGEIAVGRNNLDVWPMYVWLDLDLKEEMTGRR